MNTKPINVYLSAIMKLVVHTKAKPGIKLLVKLKRVIKQRWFLKNEQVQK